MNEIHAALVSVPQESREKVIRSALLLLGISLSAEATGGSSRSPAKNPPSADEKEHEEETEEDEDWAEKSAKAAATPSLKPDAFLKQKKPSSVYETLACLGYYLEHYRNQQYFGSKDLEKLNTDARQSPIDKLSLRIMHTSQQYQYFAASGGGKKQLTSRGTAVVEALPDPEAVKKAKKDNPLKGTRKRKAKE